MQPSSGQHDSAERVWGSGRVQAARKLLREKIQGSPEPPSPNSTQQLTMQAGTAPPSDGSGPQAATGARVSLAARTSTVRAPALKLKGLQGKLAKGFEALWQRQVVVKRKSGIQWPELSGARSPVCCPFSSVPSRSSQPTCTCCARTPHRRCPAQPRLPGVSGHVHQQTAGAHGAVHSSRRLQHRRGTYP